MSWMERELTQRTAETVAGDAASRGGARGEPGVPSRAEEGIRYLWPEKVTGRSRNFWIRWKAAKGFVVERRVNHSPSSPVLGEQAFDEDSVEQMMKCPVTGARIKPASLQPGRFHFIWSRR